MRAECSVGRASVSSSEFVCSDWVGTITAARAWSATRTILLWGCCAVREHLAVCEWKRRIAERGFLQWNRSVITLYQILRAARYLAISSKKPLWALKKNDNRGAKSSTFIPARLAHSTYSMPS